MTPSIAIVEDDAILRQELVQLFTENGYRVHEANQYQGLLDILRLHSLRLILLDLNLPGKNGFEIAESLRQSHPGVGIVMLTARAHTEDRVRGYHAGADIYLTKPADPQEILAAIASIQRRLDTAEKTMPLALDTQRPALVDHNDKAVPLTMAEAWVLRALILAPESTVETGDLLDMMDERFPDRHASRRALENLISRLRSKTTPLLDADAQIIRSLRGVGYQLGITVQLLD